MAEKIKVMLSEQEVDAKICEIGKQISEDYAGKQVHLVRSEERRVGKECT